MSTTDKTATSTITTVPDWDELPCVQYGFPEGKGPVRAPKLRTIFKPIPDDANTASPVYVLTRDEYDYHESRDNPYQVEGYTSIATELQDKIESDDRVLYPIHIESDELRKLGPTPLMGWFHDFVEDYLDVPFHTCTLYFSGRRSIHVHVPRFVSGERARERLKDLAETFCKETGAKLDCGLYSAKRMFRLPGVEHEKTGVPKLEIDGEWDNARLAQKVKGATPDVPESYEAILRRVFLQSSLMKETAEPTAYTPHDLFRVLDSDKTVLEFEPGRQEIETPLIEQQECPYDTTAVPTWAQYNAKEFSPYALASGNGRSVAVVKVKGTPFVRKEVRNGAPLVPVYFYGARGCAGGEFTKADEHAPLQLSEGERKDYQKWMKRGVQPWDHIVIIGGQSRSSIIFRVEPWQATVAGHALTGEDASRQAALDYLESEGYDVGRAGTSGKAPRSKTAGTRGGTDRNRSRYATGISPVQNPITPAARLQQRAEQVGIETLGHIERGRVACRTLGWGWEPAWEWFKEQYGPAFKPDVTWSEFKNIVETYPEYEHVEVPPKPR